MSWDAQHDGMPSKERDVSPKRPSYRQRYHEAWVTVSPGDEARKSPALDPSQPPPHHHYHHHHNPGYPPASYGYPPPHHHHHYQHPSYDPASNPPWQPHASAAWPPPAQFRTGHPAEAPDGNASVHSEHTRAVSGGRSPAHSHHAFPSAFAPTPRHTVPSGVEEGARGRRGSTREEADRRSELELVKTRLEIEKQELQLQMQREVDAERDQNAQSAAVIAQQMTLIENLKAKIDALVDHAKAGTQAEEQRRQLDAELHETRPVVAALQEQVRVGRTQLQQFETERVNLEREKLAWQRERNVLLMDKDVLSEELVRERRSLEGLRRDHANELEELLRQHELEQTQQNEVNARREHDLAARTAELSRLSRERDDLSSRVRDIQTQREEEARSLQQEIERHLQSVEALKSELRAKQVELFGDWKNWRQQLSDEKVQLTERVMEERRDMEYKVAHATQQVEAERRRVEIEKSAVETEWKQLREAREDQRTRDREERKRERDQVQEQLRTRQAELEAREQRLAVRERSLDTTNRELEAACRDKAILEPELHKLRMELSNVTAQAQELKLEKERWQHECVEVEEKWRQQLHQVRDKHHSKLEEQCRKHSEAIEMVNRLRTQLAGKTGNEAMQNPRDTTFLERKLQETERKLLESEHGLGQTEARFTNMQAELTAAESRHRRSEDHVEELNRQIVEYKQELTEARTERENFRRQRDEFSGYAHTTDAMSAELHALRVENGQLHHQVAQAQAEPVGQKFVHLCDIHRSEGFEGLMRHDLEGHDLPLNKDTSKVAYTNILTALERTKHQSFVCAGCVTQMHHSFDQLLRMLFELDDAANEIPATEDIMVFLMALTCRLSDTGERKIHDAADNLLKIILTLDPN
ncbi:hypothetical protein DIPPA_24273 [Diplonema papillatum]|nr:hypothetical protein DIPPA_24273 [Diplonema papillatum]KAJ9444311.1 hypothetical protein DIPPA_24273 [Diplonema papillatum]